ncbi:unnamed protein product [Callosobruchus maculatus]|uniref:Uncharacterized protein n=1 Tax=Callosobruchus maculatus TaxID=64391 RepID=A0A653BM13_CALMS|nr:unnamed protein product [Callosobruchus maculatus]
MVPDEEESANGPVQDVTVAASTTGEKKTTAYEEFLSCLQDNPGPMPADKMKQLLRSTFQGQDLKYSANSSSQS